MVAELSALELSAAVVQARAALAEASAQRDHVYAGAPNHDDAVGMNNGIVRVFAPDRIFEDGFD